MANMNGNIDNTVRLGDSETLRDLAVAAMDDVIGIAMLLCHQCEQEAEMELIRDRVYETATSGTDAAGPARERVGYVLRAHGKANAHIGWLDALAERIRHDGLDTRLTDEDVWVLASSAEQALNTCRELLENSLCRDMDKLDREIMDKMPLSEDAMRKLAEELAREDATDHARDGGSVQDHKVIDIKDWRRDHA